MPPKGRMKRVGGMGLDHKEPEIDYILARQSVKTLQYTDIRENAQLVKYLVIFSLVHPNYFLLKPPGSA